VRGSARVPTTGLLRAGAPSNLAAGLIRLSLSATLPPRYQEPAPVGPFSFGLIRPLFSARLRLSETQKKGENHVIAYRRTRAALLGATLACFATAAAAQEKTRISFAVPASIAKYVAQQTIPVGDVPGHDVRIFDLVRTFGPDAPMIAGVRLKEIRSVGWSDYTDLNGPGASYSTWTLVNGDKFFTHTNIVSHNASWQDSSKKGAENRTSGPISGGTGKLAGIRGTTRNASRFDPKSGSNESRFDVEYWIQK
jgi:hypothetical protein